MVAVLGQKHVHDVDELEAIEGDRDTTLFFKLTFARHFEAFAELLVASRKLPVKMKHCTRGEPLRYNYLVELVENHDAHAHFGSFFFVKDWLLINHKFN